MVCRGAVNRFRALKWVRALESCRDVFVSVELTDVWNRHIVWAKKDGQELLAIFLQRFASITTMLTLLVGMQVGTLFSPSRPAETARTALQFKDYHDVAFWACFVLCIGIVCSILALLATLSAWALFAVVGKKNAHVILRSSVCMYAVALPIRLSLFSIYIFFIWVNLFWYVIATTAVALVLSILCALSLLFLVSLYSSVGRVILFSGALSDQRIMDTEVEEELTPQDISKALIKKAIIAKEGDIPVREQYRIKYQEQLEILEEGGSLHFEELRLSEYKDDAGHEHGENEDVPTKKESSPEYEGN